MCNWANWTSCSWFCNEDDPLIKTRNLEKKDDVLEDIDNLCNEEEKLGCYESCTGISLTFLFFIDFNDTPFYSRAGVPVWSL